MTASNTQHAEHRLATRHPDLIVCDMKLPDGTGFDLISRLRALPTRVGKTPCIAITGYEHFFPPSRVEKGFDAYLQKPLDVDKLCDLAVTLATGKPR